MNITLTDLLIWLIIAVIIGFIGEFIARRKAPDGIIGAAIVGFLAIFLVVGVFKIHITGEPSLDGVPLITSIIAAVILVFVWSSFAYHRVYRRYYRRGTYARAPRAPRRRRRFFR